MSSKRRPSSQSEDTTTYKRLKVTLPQDDLLKADTMDHHALDVKALDLMKLNSSAQLLEQKDLSEDDLSELLFSIINTQWKINGSSLELRSSGRDQLPKYITNHPMIKEALELAWRDKSFKHIRLSRFFRFGELPSPTPPQRRQFPATLSDQVEAAANAWNSSYKGTYAKMLVDAILDEHLGKMQDGKRDRPKTPPTNYLVVIQSSGAGKSRTVDETGATLFLISINLRERGGTGYPLRDEALCLFIDEAKDLNEIGKKIYCAAFITGIFSAALLVLGEESIKPLQFKSRFSAGKVRFDADATEKAREAMQSRQNPDGEKLNSVVYKGLLKDAKSAILKFAEAAGIPGAGNELVLLAIDECHTLYHKMPTRTRSTYHSLCSVLHDLIQTPIFAIFMSTTSHARQLAPPAGADPSLRIVNADKEHGLTQHLPYVAFPFDIYNGSPIIIEDEKTLEDVCEVSFLCRFGRPLWWTRWETGSEKIRDTIVTFAMMKLCNNEDLIISNEAVFAALSTRHLLMFEPDRRSGITDDEYTKALDQDYVQVASHMRTVHSIPSHREYMRTSTPSEPLLAEAAAQLLKRWDGSQVKFLAQELNVLVSKGELGGRLLCNLAHDTVTTRMPSMKGLEYAQPILFLDFLRALLADKWHAIILESRPVDGGGTSFADAFRDYYVHFTHWSKMGDASCLTTAALWKAIARGTAWQCCDNMPGIDRIIPLVKLKTSKLGRSSVSLCAMQDKNQVTAKILNLSEDFVKTVFTDAPEGQQHPFVFFTMQPGVQPTTAVRATKFPSTPSKAEVSKGPHPRASKSLSATGSKHPRYDITITGYSPTVYKVIQDKDRDHWAQLLSSRSLKMEHPRKTPDQLEALVRSKPMFWHGPHSFDWAKDLGDVDEFLDEEEEEGVIVGKGSN